MQYYPLQFYFCVRLEIGAESIALYSSFRNRCWLIDYIFSNSSYNSNRVPVIFVVIGSVKQFVTLAHSAHAPLSTLLLFWYVAPFVKTRRPFNDWECIRNVRLVYIIHVIYRNHDSYIALLRKIIQFFYVRSLWKAVVSKDTS